MSGPQTLHHFVVNLALMTFAEVRMVCIIVFVQTVIVSLVVIIAFIDVCCGNPAVYILAQALARTLTEATAKDLAMACVKAFFLGLREALAKTFAKDLFSRFRICLCDVKVLGRRIPSGRIFLKDLIIQHFQAS